ncbi:heterodisulfide reductase-related iron-sulfur binding cluster, partial [Phenylobacterium sp.]|uniref:heterodisulfide reductase-related iron-sulfur binding cluster n=1 Tax=Phenylobacterium sp. TaxID=1871053 RepID=UPI002F3E3808
LIPAVLARPGRLRKALALGRMARPLGSALEACGFRQLAALLRLVPKAAQTAPPPRRAYRAEGAVRGRVALLQGCVEPVMAPSIREAAISLITRAGFEVVLVEGEGCCGALSEHLGRADEAAAFAAANVRAWTRAGPFDAILTTAAGCGTTLKAYGRRLAGDPGASHAGAIARDVLEFIGEIGLPPVTRPGALSVAYHAPCSLQHGQAIKAGPAALLSEAGFDVRPIAEGHLCCGSAGVYNILQPELAGRLQARKAANIARTGAAVVAASNVGCIAQIAPVVGAPVVHPVELLDWATGGPRPAALAP